MDVDALCDGTEVSVAGIMQHVEEAGVHSGDSACVLPPMSLGGEMLDQIRETTTRIALELGVIGLINIQYAVARGELYVIEANPRASRTIPFVSKAIGAPLAKVACRLMLGEKLADQDIPELPTEHVSVKEAVLPFARFAGADAVLGPEMKSTGEVMGVARDFPTAFAKAQAAAGVALPLEGSVFITVTDNDKAAATQIASRFHDLGFEIIATRGTAQAISRMGIPVRAINKIAEGSPHVVDFIRDENVDLVINTPTGSPRALGRLRDPQCGGARRRPLHHHDDRRLGGGQGDPRRADPRRRAAEPPGAPRSRGARLRDLVSARGPRPLRRPHHQCRGPARDGRLRRLHRARRRAARTRRPGSSTCCAPTAGAPRRAPVPAARLLGRRRRAHR